MEQKSKRSALRYTLPPHRISYRKKGQTGEATLINISTAGLFAEMATLPLQPGDEIALILDCFKEQDDAPLELKGKMVRVNFDEFAASFIDIDREQMVQLLRLLAQEKRTNMGSGLVF
ncbi:PilZ domain-containing protein [Desulfofustis limnaeus]|uniref:PilZ domain-containing protein n=1 Tax=Desulfofustis limnaeus TaxID=2740163 RepID=A0ABM7W6V2_9BACT|nr:PilZ domain-containing protein [Desulfofustis limnaeus]BDD86663.1 hypothetical protein DPPLL_10280 [Desulfofustis limnaeus]